MEIVPISGLVLSKLCRMENEHKTVLDLWEPAKIAKSLEDSRTPLESAVIKSDIKQVASILKSGMAYINEQDANGWTSLHLSCSYCFNDPRLEVTEYLLAIPDIDSTILNNYGNTALHYFARIPVTSDIQHKYRNILLNFVSSKDMLFQQNLKVPCFLQYNNLVIIVTNPLHFFSFTKLPGRDTTASFCFVFQPCCCSIIAWIKCWS